jgi:hypothetical protein
VLEIKRKVYPGVGSTNQTVERDDVFQEKAEYQNGINESMRSIMEMRNYPSCQLQSIVFVCLELPKQDSRTMIQDARMESQGC